jgi:ribonuclease HII
MKSTITSEQRLQFDLEQLEDQNTQDSQTTDPTNWLVGIDEVGYGCFAGPLVVGAVALSVQRFQDDFSNILKTYPDLNKVRDSKKVQEKMRERIKESIIKLSKDSQVFFYAYGESTVDEINRLGMTKAHNLATERALKSLREKSILSHCLIIIDGNKIDECLKKELTTSIIKADDKSFAVGCAAILAKQYRDSLMKALDQELPGYDFATNKGYGTKKHRVALKIIGLTSQHRLQFCKNHV